MPKQNPMYQKEETVKIKKDSWLLRGLFVAGGWAVSSLVGLPVGGFLSGGIKSLFGGEEEQSIFEQFNFQEYDDSYGLDFAGWGDYYAWQEATGIETFYETDTGDLGTVTVLFDKENVENAIWGVQDLYEEGAIEVPDMMGNIYEEPNILSEVEMDGVGFESVGEVMIGF